MSETASLRAPSLGFQSLLCFKSQFLSILWLLSAMFRLCLFVTIMDVPSAPAAGHWTLSSRSNSPERPSSTPYHTYIYSLHFSCYHFDLYHPDLDDYNSLFSSSLSHSPFSIMLTARVTHAVPASHSLSGSLFLASGVLHILFSFAKVSHHKALCSQAFPECSSHWCPVVV